MQWYPLVLLVMLIMCRFPTPVIRLIIELIVLEVVVIISALLDRGRLTLTRFTHVATFGTFNMFNVTDGSGSLDGTGTTPWLLSTSRSR